MHEATGALGLFHLFRPVTFNDWTNFNLLVQRITAACVAFLSTLGFVLAMLGLFGAISYSVSERKKELGVRVALGARRQELSRMVLRQTCWITGMGVITGLLLGTGTAIFLRSHFYGIGTIEWVVLIPVGAAMMAISLLVAYFSARPWIAADPMEALRHS
jgi:ABC-type antimicrobial peptide transport system permease subunit